MNYFVIVISVILLGILMYIDFVILFVGEDFRSGIAVIPILLLANIFLGIYYNLSIWYKLTNKTIYGAYLYSFGAIITVVLNIIWIPIFGYMGSAWATLICYFAMMLASYLLSRKYYVVKYNIGKIIWYIGSAMMLYLISQWINISDFSFKIIVNSAFFFAYLTMLYFMERKRLTVRKI